MSDFFQWVLSLLIVLGVSGAIIALIILAEPFVTHYAELYWAWAYERVNGREDSKNVRS